MQRSVKIIGLAGAVLSGIALIMQGQVQEGVGLIAASVSSASAFYKVNG